MKKLILIISLSVFFQIIGFSQTIQSMEFQRQEMSDILLALGEASGITILPDDTVSGKVSFYFSSSTLMEALEVFSQTYNLFYQQEGNLIKVSRIKSSFNSSNNTLSIKANNVSLNQIIAHITNKINKTVLFDTLPQSSLSLDIADLSVEDVLDICIRKFPEYEVEKNENFFYIKKIETIETKKNSKIQDVLIKDNGLYTLNLEKGRLMELLIQLFSMEQQEYSLFIKSDVMLENLYFANKDFNSILQLVLEHANAEFVIKDNIYYLLDLQRSNINGKLHNTNIIPLRWLQATEVVSLFPPDITSNATIKVDKNTNSLLITGTSEEITNIEQFLALIDIPLDGLIYKKIDIKYLDVKDVCSLIPPRLLQNTPVIIPGTNSVLFSGTAENIDFLEEFVANIDNKKTGYPIQLKYIKTETLLKSLPPSISKEHIVDSGFPNLVFYTGSDDNLKLFKQELKEIDKPQPQIRYQLLVIQYSKGKGESFTPALTVSPTESTAKNFIFNGELNNIMGLSFDVISKFGYQFAASLNTKIHENTANVFTDTTLTGISGQDIKFQNTDTYRYIEYDYDTTTDSLKRTSATQQITSGLIVNLNGWISGDNMITMTVNATISKQNSDSGSSNSKTLTTLPSTSERVVTTQVRTKSGEPVIISGLIKEDDSDTQSRTPHISKIPFFGNLFKQTSSNKEKTEIVIYIVPHLIQEYSKSDLDNINTKRYYDYFLGKKNGYDR